LLAASVATTAPPWRILQAGVEYSARRIVDDPRFGDGLLHVVRIDSGRAKIVVRAASAGDKRNRTAAQWAKDFDFAAVINAGMYGTDFSTHIGALRVGKHWNNKTWVRRYKSVLMVGRGDSKTRIRDADALPEDERRYDAVVQNLRLIAGPGRNVWSKNRRKWSEAAVAMDADGRILFLFSRTPLSMSELNGILLRVGLGITHAQHLEGGPEASLSVRAGGVDLDLAGSYETDFMENDRNTEQWPLPNVIAVVRK
jgi:hypothetical protein